MTKVAVIHPVCPKCQMNISNLINLFDEWKQQKQLLIIELEFIINSQQMQFSQISLTF